MSAKKTIEVNSSSLVGLKAELFRKQEALRKERLQQNSTTVKAKPIPKKPSIWTKKNAGVQARADKDKTLTAEEENKLDKSRAALEAKTKIYEQMKQNVLSTDHHVSDRFLVDFEKKAIDELQDKETHNDEDEETEYELGATNVPGPVHPDEEWVDYVDTLGRSRRCMKKDLPELISMDKRLNPQAFKEKEAKEATTESLPDLLSNDMHREMMRKKWEKEEEEMRKRGPGPVHYQNVRFDEVREMGVGYFDFSKDESERQKQMEMLEHLRGQTIDKRTKSQQLKAKRKAALQARLEKVKQRKRLKGELVEDEEEHPEEEPEEETEVKEEAEQQVEDVKRLMEKVSRTPPIRPWDIGKDESKWDRVKKQLREERPQEFAPPGCYDRVSAPSGNDRKSSSKQADFAPPASYTLKSKPVPHTSQHEFAPPMDYGDRQDKLQSGRGTFLDRGRAAPPGESSKPLPRFGRTEGAASVSAGMGGQHQEGSSERKQVIGGDSIAQGLSFLRQNLKK